MTHSALTISNRITCLPVIHGSGDFALAVREAMLATRFDCVAVPLPPSFQSAVEQAIVALPTPAVVTQEETPRYRTEWSPAADADFDDDGDEASDELAHSYVPVDP